MIAAGPIARNPRFRFNTQLVKYVLGGIPEEYLPPPSLEPPFT